MNFELRDYQAACIKDDDSCTDRYRMYAAPTGTGKSIPELCILQKSKYNYLITPSLEIISDLLLKLTGERYSKPSSLLPMAAKYNISTPVRLRNSLLRGSIPRLDKLIIDEVHHDNAETYKQVSLLCGERTSIRGFTATPYRGTPKGTRELIGRWGEPIHLLSITDAVERGYYEMPKCKTIPLIDDDTIELTNGEFVVETIKRETESKIRDIGNLIRDMTPGIPTMVSMPTRENIYSLETYLKSLNIPCRVVTDKVHTTLRHNYFREAENCESILLQIKAVSEGNDLKIYRLIDCTPSISPVAFMQRFGRICRPNSMYPHEYYCTNRNLLRHAYLFEGNLPSYEYAESKAAFVTDSKRLGMRAWDIESMGRFKPAHIKFTNGIEGEVYSVVQVEGNISTEYTAIVHPLVEDVIWGKRVNKDGKYGRYSRLSEAPNTIKGFASKTGQVTTKQEEWFSKKAGSFGLDTTGKLDKRVFQAFIALQDMRIKIK